MRCLPLLAAFALACAGDAAVEDADYDGVADEDDCAPSDALIYPGAYDAPGDGVDADCDGSDSAFPYEGDWVMDQFAGDFSGTPVFVPGTESGTLTLTADSVHLVANVTLVDDLVGTELPVPLDLAGPTILRPEPNAVDFDLEGELIGYDFEMPWSCEAVMDSLECTGLLSITEFGQSINLQAAFSPADQP